MSRATTTGGLPKPLATNGRGLLVLRPAAACAPVLLALAAASGAGSTAQSCPEPYQVSRQEILLAMSGHGAYSLTSTTTSMRFGAEALLALVRRRQLEAPGSTQLLVRQDDWFAAHLETAGVTYARMSASARAAFEHHQDALVDYGPGVVERVVRGPRPKLALDVTIYWPDSGDASAEFRYDDTLSVPRLQVSDSRIVRFKLLEYEDQLLFDEIRGISVRPLGFFSAIFALLGKPDLRRMRLAVSPDQWQVVRGQVKVFPGFSKTGTAVIEPGGRGHEGIPPARQDLGALKQRTSVPLELRYGAPSCQVELRTRQRQAEEPCHRAMGGAGTCGTG